MWSWGKDPSTAAINVIGSAAADVLYNTATNSWGKKDAWLNTGAALGKYFNQHKSTSSSDSGFNGEGASGSWGSGATPKHDPYNSEMARLNAELARLQSQRTPVPRFFKYDTAASWDRARQMANDAVSPIYKQKFDDFVNRQNVELGREKTDITNQKGALDLALSRLLEDTAVSRNRATEDSATNINDIQDAFAFNTRQQSLNTDTQQRAQNEQLGASGMADSGLGQQQVQEFQLATREASNEQIRQTDNKVAAQKTLLNRTFEDLQLKETRETADTNTSKQKLDVDLERFIDDQAYKRDQKNKELELSKAADIANKSIGIQKQLVDQWVASLAGQGATAQEIANAASIYR